MAHGDSASIKRCLCTENKITEKLEKGRIRWLAYVERMPEETSVKKAFKNIPEKKGLLENQERDGWTTIKII
jgi:hypothetical protein